MVMLEFDKKPKSWFPKHLNYMLETISTKGLKFDCYMSITNDGYIISFKSSFISFKDLKSCCNFIYPIFEEKKKNINLDIMSRLRDRAISFDFMGD